VPLRSLAVLQLAAHIPQEGMLVAGIPGGCNLAVHQAEHSQNVAGNPYVLLVAGSFQVAEDNQNLVGQLEHNVTHPQLISITFCTCGCISSFQQLFIYLIYLFIFNPLNPKLNPICYFLALLGAHHFLHVSRIRVKLLTFRLLMSYIYIDGAPILDVSRSHTTTQHSR